MQISFATISNHTSLSKLLLPAKHALTFLCSREHPFQRSHEDLLKSHYPPHSAGRLLSQHQTSHLPQWLRRLPATHHLSHWCQNHPEQSNSVFAYWVPCIDFPFQKPTYSTFRKMEKSSTQKCWLGVDIFVPNRQMGNFDAPWPIWNEYPTIWKTKNI